MAMSFKTLNSLTDSLKERDNIFSFNLSLSRHVANGEILSVSLLMEDVLAMGVQENAMKRALRDTEDGEERASEVGGETRPASSMSQTSFSRPPSALSMIPVKRTSSRLGRIFFSNRTTNTSEIIAH